MISIRECPSDILKPDLHKPGLLNLNPGRNASST